ncbi:MAG: DUF4276 family protein [Chloroflexia bacterium]|nr:DUF4276 family protein [Chloroflexia bacterium]
MFILFFTEEPSAEAALRILAPRMLGEAIEFDVQVFQGKADLLNNLPLRLRALASWMPADWRIVVLVDRDDDDCVALKHHLDQIAREAGLTPKGAGEAGQPFQVLNRLAIEELEAWFLGDLAALRTVYPRIRANLERRERYRDPDTMVGGTWEALERELQRAGYHQGGLPKIEVARRVAVHMQPERNRSRSFQTFYRGLQELITAR